MRFNQVLIAFGVCLLTLMGVASSCKKSEDAPQASYDTTPLLTNVGNNLIIPSFQRMSVAANKLDSAITVFNTTPTVTTLSNLQAIFKDTYRAWEYSAPYDFGPAMTVHLKANMNTYPTTTTQINTNISSGSYNLDASLNLSAKGLPAIDYLLFGIAADNASIVLKYTTDTDAAKRKQYLADLSTDIKTKVSNTLNAWLPSGGNYIHDFISSTGTDAGSSLSLLVNQFVLDYDNGKHYKVFVPVGDAGGAFPEKTEAYYSGISAELILLTTKVSQDLYLGRSYAGVDGKGFDDFMIGVDAKRQSDGAPLDPLIKAQYVSAINIWTTVPDPFSQTIGNNPTLVGNAYTELQKQIPLIKREMTAAMGVLVSFGDADGD